MLANEDQNLLDREATVIFSAADINKIYARGDRVLSIMTEKLWEPFITFLLYLLGDRKSNFTNQHPEELIHSVRIDRQQSSEMYSLDSTNSIFLYGICGSDSDHHKKGKMKVEISLICLKLIKARDANEQVPLVNSIPNRTYNSI